MIVTPAFDLCIRRRIPEDNDYITTPAGKNEWVIRIVPPNTSSEDDWFFFQAKEFYLDAFTESEDEAAEEVTARPMQFDVATERAQLQIKDWLKQCDLHRQCSDQYPGRLPKRVIDVGSQNDSSIPKLYTTHGEKAQYVALSYCWGGPQSGKLENNNLRQYCVALDTRKLSQTVQDAIHVVRAVGLRYLWVDAICIIQDDDNDRATEISVMSQIYQRALFTIAAESAQSARNGFLEKKQRPSPSYRVPFRCQNGRFGTMSMHLDTDADDISIAPLHDRAWTFQELMLSPRLLLYTSRTLKWYCRGGQYNLGSSYSAGGSLSSGLLTSVRLYDKALSAWRAPPKYHWIDPWSEIVWAYSYRALTDPGDRLKALSGIATALSISRKSKYLAGLWEDSLAQHLCWFLPHITKNLREPRPYTNGAPSWSWASVIGEVNYEPSSTQSVCKVVEAKVEPKSPVAPFADVQDGWLLLKASVQFGHYRRLRTRGTDSTVIWERPSQSGGTVRPDSVFSIYTDAKRDDPEGDAYFLVLTSQTKRWLRSRWHKEHRGLLLEKVGDNTYRRIGLFGDGGGWSKLDEEIEWQKWPRARKIKIV